MADKNNKPIFSVRAGSIQGAVFLNKIKGTNNKPDFEVQTISLSRSFTKDEGKTWEQQAINMRKNDLAKLQVVLTKLLEQQFLNTKEVDSEE